MDGLQALEIIEEIASLAGVTVHSASRKLKYRAPALEREVVQVGVRKGLDPMEIKAWYRKQHKEYLQEYKIKTKLEHHIAKKQHNKRIQNLLSA